MVKGPLVDRFASVGRKLVELLDEAQILTQAAFWLYRQESEDWVLILALPEAEESGPLAAYTTVQQVVTAHTDELQPLKFDDIVVTGPDDSLVQLLRHVIHTGSGISEIRFSQNRIDNTFIEDALIYRLQ